jgi:DNA-binding transcriptional MerR regulator/methylmalonyl-CoA mutase cobalamin-binding subunit
VSHRRGAPAGDSCGRCPGDGLAGFRSDLRSVGGEPSKRGQWQLGLSEGTSVLTVCPGARLDLHWTGVHFVAMTRHADADIARHPIGVVAERTGLSPDLLRVWERRYRAVEPPRSLDGQRSYSDGDVERLRLLRLATMAGRSIRQVARLPTDELARLVREDEAGRQEVSRRAESAVLVSASEDVERALELARAVNAPGLESFLRRSAAAFGVPVFLDGLAAPLLRRMGEEWEAGRLTPAQEHVATAIVQRVLEGAIHFLVAPHDAPNLVLATPVDEQHKMGSMLAATAAAAEGWSVTYLGPDLPAGEIAAAALAVEARVVGVSIIYPRERDRVLAEMRTLRSRLSASVPLVAGGAGAVALAPELRGAGIRVLQNLSDLRAALRASLMNGDGTVRR